jgi:hypothetical protein
MVQKAGMENKKSKHAQVLAIQHSNHSKEQESLSRIYIH